MPQKCSIEDIVDWCGKIKMVQSWAQSHSNGHHTISNAPVVSQVKILKKLNKVVIFAKI